MRFLTLLLLLAAIGCTPESPERVVERHYRLVQSAHLSDALRLLTPEARAGFLHPEKPYGRVRPSMTRVMSSALFGTRAYPAQVLRMSVEGDTARLVVQRSWLNLPFVAARLSEDADHTARMASFVQQRETEGPSLALRRAVDALQREAVARVVATHPNEAIHTDTATYVLARQYNVWRIADDGGLLTAPVTEIATSAAPSAARRLD